MTVFFKHIDKSAVNSIAAAVGVTLVLYFVHSLVKIDMGSSPSAKHASHSLKSTLVEGLYIDDSRLRLGVISPSATHDAGFTVINQSNEEMTLKGVYTDCGCTAVDFKEKQVLKPGAEKKISVRYTANEFGNKFIQRQVILTVGLSEQPDDYKVPMLLTAQIDTAASILCRPGIVQFGPIAPDSSKSVKLTLYGDRAFINSIPSSIDLDLENPNTVLAVSSSPFSGVAAKKTIVIRAIPQDEPDLIDIDGVLKIIDSENRFGALHLPIKAQMGPPIRVHPNKLIVSYHGEKLSEALLTINSVKGLPGVKIKSVSNDLGLETRVISEQGNRLILGIRGNLHLDMRKTANSGILNLVLNSGEDFDVTVPVLVVGIDEHKLDQ